MQNIAETLTKQAKTQPDSIAVYEPARRFGKLSYKNITYTELDRLTNRFASGLRAHDIQPGTRMIVMVPVSRELFIVMFGLFKAGVIPILIDPGMGLGNVKICLSEVEPHGFISVFKGHVARKVLGWDQGRPTKTISLSGPFGLSYQSILDAGTDSFENIHQDLNSDAAILFTSGSTGVPKGVVYQHSQFLAQVDSLQTTFGLGPGQIDFPTLPGFALFDIGLGITIVIPEMDFTKPAKIDPDKAFKALNDFKITNMFGSPALLNRLSRAGVKQEQQLPHLNFVVSAGAAVPPAIMERFASLLNDDALIYTPYGATESLPIAVTHHKAILKETRAASERGAGTCVGTPVAKMRVDIIAITDDPLPEWDDATKLPVNEIGEIVVTGPVVTHSYYNREASTAAAKIKAPDGTISHRMGDVGYLDDQGQLWFGGRKKQRVILADKTLFTVPAETIINTHPCVYRSALVGVEQNGQSKAVICIEIDPEAPYSNQDQIRSELQELAAQHAATADISQVLFHKNFPVDIRHNTKIFREKLAVWAQEQLA